MSSMATNSEFSAGNAKFALLLLVLAIIVVALWLGLHPKSPLRSFREYTVAFPEVGTLKPGSPVQIQGLKRGFVSSTVLTDDAVLVRVKVESAVEIPKDSRFRVINAGLLGQRTGLE